MLGTTDNRLKLYWFSLLVLMLTFLAKITMDKLVEIQLADKHINLNKISYISGFITTSCTHQNKTECQKLIEWGRDVIDQLK